MKHTDKGRSVFAGRSISKGEYVCQYHGELISSKMLKQRNQEYNTHQGQAVSYWNFKTRNGHYMQP